MPTAVFQEMRQASATLLWPELLTSAREIARCDAYVGTLKFYQHRPQIAKNNSCVINVENSVTSARSSRQFFWLFFWMPLLCRLPWAPCNGTTSTPPKLVVTLPPNHSALQWHPARHHVHSPKVGRHPTPQP